MGGVADLSGRDQVVLKRNVLSYCAQKGLSPSSAEAVAERYLPIQAEYLAAKHVPCPHFGLNEVEQAHVRAAIWRFHQSEMGKATMVLLNLLIEIESLFARIHAEP